MTTLLKKQKAPQGISRREFMMSTGAASIVVAFGAFTPDPGLAQSSAFTPNAWINMGADGIVTIYSPSAEMGQGVKTSMPLLVAEDMDLDWSKVRVEQPPSDAKKYGNPLFGRAMVAGASRTTRGYYEMLRLAGHQGREVIRFNAAKKWGVPLAEVTTEPHVAVHAPSGRKMSYGEIAAFAEVPADFPKSTKEQLKPVSAFRLVGKDTPRVDVPDKVSGKTVYGIDVVLPGMLYGSIARAPVQGETPLKVDDSESLKIAGVKQIVRLPYGVGVIADNYWSAQTARKALKIEWSQTAKARAYSSAVVLEEYKSRARNIDDKGVQFVKAGDPETVFKTAYKVIEADFTTQHVAHACMEPMTATAQVTGDRLEVWAPTQAPSFNIVAAGFQGFPPDKVKINTTMLGGGFGRKVESDFVVDAILLAKAMPGTPVKVVWTREDDIKHDKYRPLVAQHLTAAMDASGKVLALRHRIVSESIYARALPALMERYGGKDSAVYEGSEALTYDVPNRSAYYMREQRGVDVGFWRSVGPGYTKFAVEGMMDELAAAAKKDPLDFRLGLLADQPAAAETIRTVAAMSNWKKARPRGRALGLAYSDTWDTHVAQVAEVSIDRKTGRIRVHEVWCAVDPGIVIQPRNLAIQMESSIMYGLSTLLGEKAVFEKGEVQASNFHDYPILRMNEAPVVHVKVLQSGGKPGGAGEVGLPPIAPAVASAIFKLTGKRLRDLPFDPNLLKT